LDEIFVIRIFCSVGPNQIQKRSKSLWANTKVFSDFGGEEEIEAGGAKRADGFEGILAGGLHVVALKVLQN